MNTTDNRPTDSNPNTGDDSVNSDTHYEDQRCDDEPAEIINGPDGDPCVAAIWLPAAEHRCMGLRPTVLSQSKDNTLEEINLELGGDLR